MEKLWTATEVAQHLGVTEEEVEQLVREGKLTGYQLGGKFLRFRPSQVEGLKQQLPHLHPSPSMPPTPNQPRRSVQLLDLLYFYDFYLVSAALLVVMLIYLIAAW